MFGEGFAVNDAISKMSMVVEGYYATKNAFEISKNNKESFYIIDNVFDILYNMLYRKSDIYQSVSLETEISEPSWCIHIYQYTNVRHIPSPVGI